jgi:hypothetical protein
MRSAEELRFGMAQFWLILVAVLANTSLAQERPDNSQST